MAFTGFYGAKRFKISSVSDLYFLCRQFFTMLANDTLRKSLEATNVPVLKLTRSATHVSDNQASVQLLDSGDSSTLPSPCLPSSASSSERSEQLTKTLDHRHSTFTWDTP